MKTTIGLKVSVQGSDPGDAVVAIETLPPAERGRRAFKVAMPIAFGGLAVAFVPIPILHLVLSFGLLVTAVVVYVRIQRQDAQLTPGDITCPSCTKAFELPAQSAVWPIEWNCPNCRRRLHLEPLTKPHSSGQDPD